jgi:hypothetical protein
VDHAVALVQSYLQLNGYFTVVEYPILEERRGDAREITDIDILAFRFPGAGKIVTSLRGRHAEGPVVVDPDPELGCPRSEADMLIGEVKLGHAELNRGARDPAVLCAVLSRFGCCDQRGAALVAEQLIRHGHARTHAGHAVRLVAFGSVVTPESGGAVKTISLGHVVRYLQKYIHENWDVLRRAQIRDAALGQLVAVEKALRYAADGLLELPSDTAKSSSRAAGSPVAPPAHGGAPCGA